MLTVTEVAQQKIGEILAGQGHDDWAVRVRIVGRGIESFAYDLNAASPESKSPGDLVVNTGAFEVFVDPESAPLLEGAVVDFDEEHNGFRLENPNPVWEDELGKTVAKVIIEQVNPSIAGHGGAVLPVGVRDGVVYVRMFGGCQGCGMANVTLTQGVQQAIMQAVPEITDVVDVTHHAAGMNPYYK